MERTVRVNLVAATSAYDASMARSGAVTAATSGKVKGLGTTAGTTMGTLDKFGPMLLGGAGLVKGFQATAGAAIEWESAMAGVQKTVDGTPAQLAAIGDGLRDMSKELPTSAEDLALVAESAGQLGIETPNVLGFTRVIADLGETTNLAGQEGATALARFANITQMSQGDFDRLGSTVVDLGNNFATTEAEIVEMGLRLAGAGAQIGLTESDILGVAAALTSVGINAEAGGTAFSKVMIDIANAAASGGDELDAFADVAGVTSEAFAQMVRESPDEALVALVEGLGAASDRGEDLFGIIEGIGVTEVRMRDALLRSAGAGELLADALGTGNDAWRENTALTEEAELRYDTFAAQLDIFLNKARDAGRTVGEDLTPALSDALAAASDLMDALGQPITLGRADGDTSWLAAGLGGAVSGVGNRLGLSGLMSGRGEQSNEALEAQAKRRAAARNEADRYVDSLLAMHGAQRDAANSAEGLDDSSTSLLDALGGVRNEAYLTADGVLELSMLLDDLLGINISAERAAIALEDGWGDLRDTIAESTKVYDENGDVIGEQTATLDINTEAGRNNRLAILDQADAIRDDIQARHDQGDSLADIAVAYDGHISQLRDVLTQAGLTEAEVDRYIDTLGLTPEQILTEVQIQAGEAFSILDRIQAQLRAIPSSVVTRWRMEGRDVAGVTGFGGVTISHGGGMAGAGWRRYHAGGLAGDEVPAILQRGEYVVDKGTTSAAGGAAGIEQMLSANYAIGRGGGSTAGGGMIRIDMPVALDGRQIGSSWALIDALAGKVAERGRIDAGAGL